MDEKEIKSIESIMGEEAQEFTLRPGCKNENKGLFFNGRLPRGASLPEGYYKYDFRGSDYDPGRLTFLEKGVGVNHAGTFITKTPVEFPKAHPDWISLKGKGGYSLE